MVFFPFNSCITYNFSQNIGCGLIGLMQSSKWFGRFRTSQLLIAGQAKELSSWGCIGGQSLVLLPQRNCMSVYLQPLYGKGLTPKPQGAAPLWLNCAKTCPLLLPHYSVFPFQAPSLSSQFPKLCQVLEYQGTRALTTYLRQFQQQEVPSTPTVAGLCKAVSSEFTV